MSIENFFKKYSLYQKFKINLSGESSITTPPLNLYCSKCKTIQTFNIYSEKNPLHSDTPRPKSRDLVTGYKPPLLHGQTQIIIYKCAACHAYQFYLIKVSEKADFIKKVGQYPSTDVKINSYLKSFLQKYLDYYQKGLLCEKHSFGIGAFSYYRRIVECIIDDLLNLIKETIDISEMAEFESKLKEMRVNNATDKIEAIKDHIPHDLKIDGNNPLKRLYTILSQGIHSSSDEECLVKAIEIRTILDFLIISTTSKIQYKKEYIDSIKKL